jgi:hypothetical protein
MQIDTIKSTLREKNSRTHVTSEMITGDATAPTNSSDPINSPVIPYDARAPYINMALKEYPYLSLYHSDECNDGYEFKSSGPCPGCENEHSKGRVVGRCIKGSYYIKCRSSPCEKEIKINDSPEMISSDMSQANVPSTSQSKPDHSYFRNKILDQYPNLYRECSCDNFDYYGITDETSCRDYICPLCKLGHDDEEIEGEYKAGSYFIKCEQREIEITA